jgi:DNA polymerase III delta prime subunit
MIEIGKICVVLDFLPLSDESMIEETRTLAAKELLLFLMN